VCKPFFNDAGLLYCNGGCGDDWGDGSAGCSSHDADVFCKLKTCNPNNYATSYTVAIATAVPGFTCDGYGTNYGTIFGIPSVHYQATSVLANHGGGSSIFAECAMGIAAPSPTPAPTPPPTPTPTPAPPSDADYTVCKPFFNDAGLLYCNGGCGDDWGDGSAGCSSHDADVFCQLKTCNPNNYAKTYRVAIATAVPGFTCDGYGTNYGTIFGIPSVHYQATSVLANHGGGSSIFAECAM